jgi:glycerol-3-phosphate acyltransferase PlsY
VDAAIIPLAIGSYLLGAVPAAYLAVRWTKGVDIRRQGTGNVGAANVLSTASKWLAVPVAVFDIGKGALCVWVAQLLDLGAAEQVTAGALAIIGHNWPVYLRFRGGRGVFTTLGVLAALSPKLGLIILVMPYTLAPLRQVAFGVFLAFASMPFLTWFLAQPLDINERLPVTIGVTLMAVIGLSRRLLLPRSELGRSVSLPRLVVNRLLFDRDIADRKAWIGRRPEADPGADAGPDAAAGGV